jgi:hypothetical protein
LGTNLKILSARLGITKTVALILILIAVIAALVPVDLWYSSISHNSANNTTPSPKPSPSTIISSTPTPSTHPTQTPKKTTVPTVTPTLAPYPTYQPVSTPYPSATPSPTYPPSGNGPSTTEALSNETSSTIQNFLSTLSSDQESTFSVKANSTLGNWTGNVVYSPLSWMANSKVSLGISVNVSKEVLYTAEYPSLILR